MSNFWSDIELSWVPKEEFLKSGWRPDFFLKKKKSEKGQG